MPHHSWPAAPLQVHSMLMLTICLPARLPGTSYECSSQCGSGQQALSKTSAETLLHAVSAVAQMADGDRHYGCGQHLSLAAPG